ESEVLAHNVSVRGCGLRDACFPMSCGKTPRGRFPPGRIVRYLQHIKEVRKLRHSTPVAGNCHVIIRLCKKNQEALIHRGSGPRFQMFTPENVALMKGKKKKRKHNLLKNCVYLTSNLKKGASEAFFFKSVTQVTTFFLLMV
ncbi:hypothetical protein, partial [Desulfobulbus alkaliphilus]|uniref:hypothetical protein n=1 Tax=Desulfobulbus alkaliphilus TaxID=869814 RepID=UPI001963E620